jgi:hypothetical protein
MFSRIVLALLTVVAALSASSQAVLGQAARHRAVIFIADGLRSRVVARNLSALARQRGALRRRLATPMSLARWRPSWTSTSATGARLSAASCAKSCRAGWPEVRSRTIISKSADNGFRTVLDIQSIGNARYFDAGGFFFGRTLTLSQPPLVGTRLFGRGSVCAFQCVLFAGREIRA